MDRRTFLTYNAAAAAIPLSGAALTGLANAASAAVRSAPVDFKRNVPASGNFPKKWICGSSSSMDNTDPAVQVHWYNEHTAILRQNNSTSNLGTPSAISTKLAASSAGLSGRNMLVEIARTESTCH